ncbi:hypothetical protein P23_0671 [Acinetobacter calcoaceticus]|uniref:hypothetical protein n=1 Tax=Acinetobacter calcoaceticus TaxID=471 RepID=UPI000582AAF7|nr:hypothetical protein [Acinetobacter calcoaceticus]GAM30168.1 hypothetical protein P23_0671 [Acinetobacter calcoaceticus]
MAVPFKNFIKLKTTHFSGFFMGEIYGGKEKTTSFSFDVAKQAEDKVKKITMKTI